MFNYKFIVKGIVIYSGGPLKDINKTLSDFGLPGHKISLRNKEPVQILSVDMNSETELSAKRIEEAKVKIRQTVKKNLKLKSLKIERLEVILCQ